MQDESRRPPRTLPLPKDVYLPDLQVFAARDRAGTTSGFYVAQKEGITTKATMTWATT